MVGNQLEMLELFGSTQHTQHSWSVSTAITATHVRACSKPETPRQPRETAAEAIAGEEPLGNSRPRSWLVFISRHTKMPAALSLFDPSQIGTRARQREQLLPMRRAAVSPY